MNRCRSCRFCVLLTYILSFSRYFFSARSYSLLIHASIKNVHTHKQRRHEVESQVTAVRRDSSHTQQHHLNRRLALAVLQVSDAETTNWLWCVFSFFDRVSSELKFPFDCRDFTRETLWWMNELFVASEICALRALENIIILCCGSVRGFLRTNPRSVDDVIL